MGDLDFPQRIGQCLRVPEMHHFTYGAVNPVAAYVLAFVGSLLALGCTARARAATGNGRRIRWLVIGAITLGGAIWLMHFVAILGFDVPDTPVRYSVPLTAASA